MITFTCPHCQQSISTDESDAGLVAACPACGGDIEVPSADTSIPESPVSAVPPDHERSPEKTKTGGAEAPDKVPNSLAFRDRAKSLAAAGWSEVKRNSKVAALHAQIEKLKNVDLRKAHHALGTRCHQLGLLDDQLPQSFAGILEIEERIEEDQNQEETPEDEKKADTFKRLGKQAARSTRAQALNLKLQHLLSELGQLAYSLDEQQIRSGLESEFKAINDVTSRISRKEREIESIAGESTSASRLKVLLTTAALAIFVIASVLLGQRMLHSGKQTSTPESSIRESPRKAKASTDKLIKHDEKKPISETDSSTERDEFIKSELDLSAHTLSKIYPELSHAELLEKVHFVNGYIPHTTRQARQCRVMIERLITSAEAAGISPKLTLDRLTGEN